MEVGEHRFSLENVSAIKKINNNAYINFALELIGPPIIASLLFPGSNFGFFAFLGTSTVIFTLNSALNERKHKTRKGWKYSIQDQRTLDLKRPIN